LKALWKLIEECVPNVSSLHVLTALPLTQKRLRAVSAGETFAGGGGGGVVFDEGVPLERVISGNWRLTSAARSVGGSSDAIAVGVEEVCDFCWSKGGITNDVILNALGIAIRHQKFVTTVTRRFEP